MQQLLTIQALTFLAGLALIMIGSFGGGVDVKEIKIPKLATASRAISLAFGIALLVLGIAFPKLFQNEDSSSKQSGPVITAEKANAPTELLPV
ncbi:hypothetical protein [uncultured Bradyrhizobium sp.]|uniref:hypothetical protein n=1 Tax=uncultured Bradyrhizobium sp. TaxID=199684 RepID=UPI0035C9AEAD